MCVASRKYTHFGPFCSSRPRKVSTSQNVPLTNSNFYKSGSRRGNLLISSIRSILYAPIAIMTVSREAVCIFWPQGVFKNNRFTARSSICSRLYAPIDNNNGFAWSCLHFLAETTVSRGAVCIFLLQLVAPGAFKSAPGLPRPKNVIFCYTFNIEIASSGAPLRKVIFRAGFPWASVGVSGRICSRLYAQMARIADLFETVRPDCNNNGSVRDCTLRLQQQQNNNKPTTKQQQSNNKTIKQQQNNIKTIPEQQLQEASKVLLGCRGPKMPFS